MALIVITSDPKKLLTDIINEIKNGAIITWRYDDDEDFTHTTPNGQWDGKAWLSPELQKGRIRFYIKYKYGVKGDYSTYGIFHGRFLEMLLNHFRKSFTEIIIELPK